MNAGVVGAAHQIKTDPVSVVGKSIELEPQNIGRDLGRRLDGHAADSAKRIWNPRSLRGLGEVTIGPRPHDCRPAHRGDADRRQEALMKQIEVLGEDRAGLASDLDDATARTRALEAANRDVAARLAAAIDTISGLLKTDVAAE